MADEILLVEDSSADIEFTLRALRRHDLAGRVVVAHDGAEALALLSGSDPAGGDRLRPRLVLLDLKLPKVDGIEVLRRLKNDEQTRTVPVVVLTSSAQQSDVQRAYDLGVNSYIVKPVESESFARAVIDAGLYWMLLNQAPT